MIMYRNFVSRHRKSRNLKDPDEENIEDQHLPRALTIVPTRNGRQLPPINTVSNLFSRRDSSGLSQNNFMSRRSSTEFTLATLKSYIKEPTRDMDLVDVTPDGSVKNHPILNGHIGNGHVTSGFIKGSTLSISNTIRNEMEQTTDYSSIGGSTPTVSEEDKKSKSSAGSKRKLNMCKTSYNKVDVLQDISYHDVID